MKTTLHLWCMLGLISLATTTNAQVPTCDPNVPYYLVDLRNNPTGSWQSPVHTRQGNCCSTTSPDRCTSFEILLDTGAAMISFEIASGAVPPGAMFYQIGCGPQVPVGQPICISGIGPHFLTFCKPGNNTNTYRVTSIPKPIFPQDDTTRIGCGLPVHVLGLAEGSITWTSIFPGAAGAFDNYLSCASNCDTVLYSPLSGAPPYIDYQICGIPIATQCGYVFVCDTLRLYNFSALTSAVTPNPATFCIGGPGVSLTGSASGGLAPYSYQWLDQSSTTVGSGSTLNVTIGGTYQLRVRDNLYDSLYCPTSSTSVPVTAVSPPTANAGPDQTLCANDPGALLQGSVTGATGGAWSGGAGAYNPSANTLITEYTPTAGEILSGQITLLLTTTGAGGGCDNAVDSITLFYPPMLVASLSSQSVACHGSTTALSPSVSGGSAPYTYQWNTGASTASITANAGNYCVGITDNIGCNVSICANITEPPLLVSTISSIDATTNGGSDGSATVVTSGGSPGYTYLWSPGNQTTSTATGLSYGVYTVVVTDANGCTVVSSVVVNEPRCLDFQVAVSGINILCNGDSTGTASATVSGGTAPYQYSWNTLPAQTTSNITNLIAGTWFVTVTESEGCVDVASVVVAQPTQLVNVMNNTNVSVVSGTDGSATANASGGTPPYSYLWENAATTQSITNLSAGVYSVTVTDNNGCTRIDSIQVFDPECAFIVLNMYSSSVSCAGGSDGTASAELLFGNPPYAYDWNNGDTTATITGLSAGTYTVIASEALQCNHFANITVTQPATLSLGVAATNVSCNNSNDGTIELTVSGGTYPYTYVWSNGFFVEDQSNLDAGTYSVIVTDANNCTASITATLTEPALLTATSQTTDITCNGGNTGGIDVSVSGGQLPYSYSWSNGATTQDISGLPIGTYSLTITDANNCVNSTLAIPVNEPSAIVIDSIAQQCPVPGSGVAQITVYPSGGNSGNYEISYDNGVTFMAAGQYTALLPADSIYYIVVRDTFGCVIPAADTLVINPEVEIVSASFNPCIADGMTSAQVTVNVTGGDGGAYIVSYDNGNTYGSAGDYIEQLNTGNSYSIIAMDSAGCTSLVETIEIPTEIILSGIVSSYPGGYQVSCAGSSDGSINLTVQGGVIPYSFAWSNGATTEDLSGLPAGIYTVIVTDSLTCSDTIGFTISEPVALTSASFQPSSYNGYAISCNGSSDGSINLTVNGGTTPYSYLWSNGATTEDISNLIAGSYSVVITDASGCTATNSITLTEPAVLSATVSGQYILCNGGSTGSVNLTVAGGVTTYTYAWSNGATTEDISGLQSGTYSVIVTDMNSCTATSSITLTEPASLVVTSSVTNLTCYQSADGAIDISSSGGTTPYTYLWSNAAVTEDVSGLSAGSYSVTVSDSVGCAASLSFTITEPPLLSTTIVTISDYNGYNVSCAGSSDGSIDINVSGGTPVYTYAWSNGATSQDISNISAGSYSVVITDQNGCTSTATVAISEPSALNTLVEVQPVLCNGGSNGSINITPSGGVPAYSYLWSNGATTEDISSLSTGTYSVTITDANGCVVTASATITEPALLVLNGTVTDLTCFQSGNGNIDLIVSGGFTPYTYQWSNTTSNEDLTNVAAGTYSVIVTDSAGCTQTLSFLITEPTQLIATAVVTSDFSGYAISCAGNNDGSIDLSVSGGTAGYTFVWSNGATSEDITQLTAGTYSVLVTDANGCQQTANITLSEPNTLSVTISQVDVACNGTSGGSINITPAGGVFGYSYFWSNGATTEDLANLVAGVYSVVITDANGCTTTTGATITQPTPLVLSSSVTDLTCYQSGDGAIDVTSTGGTLPYTFAWNTSAVTEDVSNLSAGNYSVIITDSVGCIQTMSFTLTEPPQLFASASVTSNYNGYNVSCAGSNDGAIDLTVSGGTPGYTYVWNNAATSEDITQLTAGTYSVIITDANGCQQTVATVLTEPVSLSATTTHEDVPCGGFLSGSIDLTGSGGVQPYTFLWSNGATTEDINGLGAGSYTVNITDANGCTATVSVQILQSSPVTLSAVSSNPLCAGDNTGSISVSVAGGNAPYTYSWSTGQTSSTITNLSGGSYMLTVTDGNGCTSTITVVLVEPLALTATATTSDFGQGNEVSNYGAHDGSIDLTVTGGTVPYGYAWSTGSNTEDIADLGSGTYIVIVTDANGCTDSLIVVLDQPLVLEMPTGYSPNSDGFNDAFVIHGIEAYPNNSLEIYNRWGNLVYNARNYNNGWRGANDSGEALPDGTYFAILQINNNSITLTGFVDLRR